METFTTRSTRLASSTDLVLVVWGNEKSVGVCGDVVTFVSNEDSTDQS